MIIGLVLATVFASALGERTGLPWSALLTIVVAPVLFIPGIETVSLDTQLILPIFIPPLLWSLARRTSWAMIRAQANCFQNAKQMAYKTPARAFALRDDFLGQLDKFGDHLCRWRCGTL